MLNVAKTTSKKTIFSYITLLKTMFASETSKTIILCFLPIENSYKENSWHECIDTVIKDQTQYTPYWCCKLYTDKEMWPEYEHNALNCTLSVFLPLKIIIKKRLNRRRQWYKMPMSAYSLYTKIIIYYVQVSRWTQNMNAMCKIAWKVFSL